MLHGCSLMVKGQHRRYFHSKQNCKSCSQYITGALVCIAWHSVRPFGSAASGPRHNRDLCSACNATTTKAGPGQWSSGRPLLGQQSRLDSLVKYERQ